MNFEKIINAYHVAPSGDIEIELLSSQDSENINLIFYFSSQTVIYEKIINNF